MPIFIHCPHCAHPTIATLQSGVRRQRCRQCGATFLVAARDDRRQQGPERTQDNSRSRTAPGH